MPPEVLTESEYRAIVSDAAADALLDCGAHCFRGSGDWLGLAIGLLFVAGLVWLLGPDMNRE